MDFKKVIIASDSTTDLSQELIDKYYVGYRQMVRKMHLII